MDSYTPSLAELEIRLGQLDTQTELWRSPMGLYGRTLIWALVLSLMQLTAATGVAQTTSSPQTQTPASQAQPPTQKTPLVFGLEDGTPIRLTLQRTISSADAHVDDTVDFAVVEEVKVKDVVVIPKGSVAWGTVTEAQPKRRMGRGGKLNVNIDAVRLADGTKVPLRAVKGGAGGGHVGAMTGAIVATGLVFFPAAPFFLFIHGKDITIPKGTQITAYINGDMNLEPARFMPKPPTSEVPSTVQTQSPGELSTANVRSTPDGAEIVVDGKYVGSTPSTIRLDAGEHTISIEKSGFKSWQRTVTMGSGGSITLDAMLDKVP